MIDVFAKTLIYNTTKIMKDALKTSKMLAEGRKMTLKGYYQSLPSSTHPKTEFINEITKRTGVSFTAARNWVIYGMKPNNPKHVSALSEITGISPEDLWSE